MSGQIPFRVRRATVDDLDALVAMWTAMQFDIVGIEKRLTEFQVAEAADGTVAVRRLDTREQEVMSFDQFVGMIRDLRDRRALDLGTKVGAV